MKTFTKVWIRGQSGWGLLLRAGRFVKAPCSLALVLLIASPALAQEAARPSLLRKQVVPILATAFDQNRKPIGVVAQLEVTLEHRTDHNGMNVRFETEPGRFSPTTEVAIVAAILNVARVANLPTDSWSVSLAVPYHGVTVYGTSLSAMVGLTVVALAQGDFIKPYRVLTGTIEPDGRIGAVGGIALKLEAARGEHLRRVLVPEEYDVTDGDWKTPFLLHVSPVRSVRSAYQALTDTAFPAHERTDYLSHLSSLEGQTMRRPLSEHVLRAMNSRASAP